MKTQAIKVIGRAFVPHVDQQEKPVKEFDFTKIYHNGYSGCLHDLKRTGNVKIMGYLYNLKPYLKLYLVKQYGEWTEVFAPNKTLLRKSTYGRIDRIIEID